LYKIRINTSLIGRELENSRLHLQTFTYWWSTHVDIFQKNKQACADLYLFYVDYGFLWRGIIQYGRAVAGRVSINFVYNFISD